MCSSGELPGELPGELLGRLGEVVSAWVGLDPDTLEVAAVGELVGGLDREVNRLQAAQAALTASFDRREGHLLAGHRSVGAWLQATLRKAPCQASVQARTARRLDDQLPATRAALQAGDISFDHAAAIAGATQELADQPHTEATLLSAARRADPVAVRKVGDRLLHRAHAQQAARQARRAYEQRQLSVRPQRETVWLQGRLHQLGGELLLTALDALSAPAADGDDRSPGQRRADALVELAERALRGGRLPADGGVRPQLTVVVPVETIEARAGAAPATLAWTGPCPPPALAQLVCDAGLDWLITDPAGLPLHLGRSARFASREQRQALRVRDGGCRWPGCPARPEWCVAHHTPPFDHGGRTDLDQLALVCPAHHGLIHHGRWTFTLDPTATVTVCSPNRRPALTETAAQARSRHLHALDLDRPHSGVAASQIPSSAAAGGPHPPPHATERHPDRGVRGQRVPTSPPPATPPGAGARDPP